MSLRKTLHRLAGSRPADFAWAERKFRSFYHRHASSKAVARRLRRICLAAAEGLLAGGGPVEDPEDAIAAARLLDAIAAGRAGPSHVRSRTGLGMEAILFLHRLGGADREAYRRLIAALPEENAYSPEYITLGPTGKCNLRCSECLLREAIFQKERQRLHAAEDVLPFLSQAEAQGISSVSFCIGEPTADLPVLFRTLERIRESRSLSVRSLVTNGLFARTIEEATAFLEGFRTHLGPEKASRCLLGVSLNGDLRRAGVPVSFTANLLEAFIRVFPGGRLALQLILDRDVRLLQDELVAELARRGALPPGEAPRREGKGSSSVLPLAGGVRVIASVMRKQPSNPDPWIQRAQDPWIGTFSDEALTAVPLKGIYTYDGGDDIDEDLVVHRITLGPDGLLYPDYHFMVAGTRPLGGTIGEAVSSFRRDPILGMLLERGGLNVLLSTYMAIPAGTRILPDIYEPARRCTTVGMAAANVLFGDGEVAAELARRMLSHGITVPTTAGKDG